MKPLLLLHLFKFSCIISLAIGMLENCTFAQTSSYSVQELLDKKSEWRSLKEPMKVEGRVSVLNSNQLLFNKLEDAITFKWNSSDIYPRTFYNTAEVYGKLELVVNKWIFTVQRIEEKPSDISKANQKSSGLSPNDPAPWYELAKWCTARATFYNDDPELLKKAIEFKSRGIQIARAKITTQDGEALVKLSSQVEQLGLSYSLKEEYLFEGFCYLYQQASKKSVNDLPELAKRLQDTLPGSLNLLVTIPPDLLAIYQKSPIPTYANATPENRRILERLLYRDIMLSYINSLTTENSSTADKQAKILQQSLPEEATLFNTFKERDLKYRAEGINTKTRQEAIELANEYKARNQIDQAKRLLESWMTSRKVRIPKERVQDRLDLADDYIKLLDDKNKSRDELLALVEQFPQDQNISDRLVKLGYKKQNGKWIPSDVGQVASTTKPEISSFPGLREGMTREQVFSEIGGPTSVTRTFAQGSMLEVWDFADHHMSITFHASTKSSLSVKEIINTNPLRK